MGRKAITIIGFAGMAVSLGILGVITHFYSTKAEFLVVAVPIFILFLIFYITEAVGPGSTDFVYPVELFPTEDRASAQGFGTSVSRIGAILGITTFPIIVESVGFSFSLFLFTGLSIMGLLATVFLGIETKGKSLEEINMIEEEGPKKVSSSADAK